MARGRMIDQRFTQSDKLNSVSRDARLVYASILPYLDRDGRMCAEPMVIKVTVFRRSDYTIEEITAALAELAGKNLIDLYADEDNDAVLQYAAFREFNSPNSRERASEFPAPGGEGSMPLRDPDILAALTPHEQRTDTPRATHVQSTDKPPTPPVHSQREVQGNVNGTGTLNENENGTHSSLQQTNPPPPELVEAAPRRAIKKPPKRRSQLLKDLEPPLLQLVNTWNEHCGTLPKVDRVGDDRHRKLQRCLQIYGDEAIDRLRDATRQVAGDEYYIRKGFGLDILLAGDKVLERSDMWRQTGGMTEADRRLATKAAKVAAAIGGLDA